jgi:predicted dehydrogenase
MSRIAIIGCGFVADLYMRSLASHPEVTVCAAHDRDPGRLAAFCAHWGVAPAADLAAVFAALGPDGVILNLTNPEAHYEVNRACLEAGHHVYSEKPLAMKLAQARALYDLARGRGLMLASAPCSVLGEAAQVLAAAVRLVYAELDDGFIPQAPYRKWQSESGAPWPYEDEFRVGCTLEHAGYYLSWLIAMFGRVETVVAASASVIPDKPGAGTTPDFSVATLFFAEGPVARLTCSIAAPHDHRIRVIGDNGVLQVARAWDNAAPVRFFRRLTIRRRLLEHPFGRRIRARGPTHPKPGRWGAASMNFALGPVEMLAALAEARACRLSNDMALHLTEITLAIQNAGRTTGPQTIQSGCERMELLPWA